MAFLAAVGFHPARADISALEWARCRGGELPERLRSCARIIGSAQATRTDRARAYLNRGRARSDAGDQDRAIQDFESALRLVPNAPDVWNGLGTAQAASGRLDLAIASYDAAIRLDPNHAIALFNRGLALRALNREAEALASFERAKQAGPRLTEPMD